MSLAKANGGSTELVSLVVLLFTGCKWRESFGSGDEFAGVSVVNGAIDTAGFTSAFLPEMDNSTSATKES